MDIKRYVFPALILLLIIGPVNAQVRTVPLTELEPQQKHLRASELITHILSTYHYKKTNLDDDLSSSILDHYLDNLDQNKAYFLKSDILEFEKYRYRIDDAINNRNLEPAFEIFKRYRKRVSEQINFALEIVKSDFDFNIDESYRYDRRDDDWSADREELNEIWRKRVKNDVLNLKLAEKKNDEIVKTLTKRYQRILKWCNYRSNCILKRSATRWS